MQNLHKALKIQIFNNHFFFCNIEANKAIIIDRKDIRVDCKVVEAKIDYKVSSINIKIDNIFLDNIGWKINILDLTVVKATSPLMNVDNQIK